MHRYLRICGIAACLAGASTLLAQEAKPADAKPAEIKPTVPAITGELHVGAKTYKLSSIMAYETKLGDDTRINVLMSDRQIPAKQLKASIEENNGEDGSFSLSQPYLKLVFTKEGKLNEYKAGNRTTSLNAGGSSVEAKLVLENDRVKGEAKLAPEGKDALQRSFEVQYDVPLGIDNAPKRVRPAGPVKPVVTGSFKGNGKQGKLAFISARELEEFSDKPALMLILTEKDHTKDPQADVNARFGRYGNALIVSLNDDGSIFGCEIGHTAFQKGSFSAVGGTSIDEFDLGDGQVSGQIVTDGEQEFFGDKWEVDLKFATPYTAMRKPTVVAENPAPKKTKKKTKPADEPKDEDEPKSDKPAEADSNKLSIYDLSLPKDANDHKYVTLTEHFEFGSKMDSLSLVKELTKSLSDQGWETDGSDLVTAKSSILHRKRGKAELTIFVKPAKTGAGSRASMMTEGLDWTKKKDEKKDK